MRNDILYIIIYVIFFDYIIKKYFFSLDDKIVDKNNIIVKISIICLGKEIEVHNYFFKFRVFRTNIMNQKYILHTVYIFDNINNVFYIFLELFFIKFNGLPYNECQARDNDLIVHCDESSSHFNLE